MRIFTILLSYAMAAGTGSLVLAVLSVLFGEMSAQHILGTAVLSAIFGGIIGLPIAAICIAVTEHFKTGNWWFFPLFGGAIGAAFTSTIAGSWEHSILATLTVFLGGAVAGITYWWFAWKVSPPDLWSNDD